MKPDPSKLLGRPPMIPAVCAGPGIPGLVSVMIPTYNRAYIICGAIDSVLAQTYKNFEVIVIDDGSTDNTRELLARYGDAIRYIHQPNAGLAAARNTGLAAARGEFVAFQDSDDLWLPWKLEGQMAVMAVDERIGLCWTDLTAVNPSGQVIRERNLRPAYSVYQRIRFEDHFNTSGMLRDVWNGCPEALRDTRYHFGEIYSAMFLGNLVHPPVSVMRRSHVAKAGGLDGCYARTCEDYEFFWRVSAHGLGALVDAPGMLYRVEAGDQLTHPEMMVYLARGNLQAVRDRMKSGARRYGCQTRRFAPISWTLTSGWRTKNCSPRTAAGAAPWPAWRACWYSGLRRSPPSGYSPPCSCQVRYGSSRATCANA